MKVIDADTWCTVLWYFHSYPVSDAECLICNVEIHNDDFQQFCLYVEVTLREMLGKINAIYNQYFR
jgi:hypothetical protein